MYNPAEEAVIEGHGQEQDLNTQRCLELQRELLSSSPLHVSQDNHNVQYRFYPQLELELVAEDEHEEKNHSSCRLSSSRDIETQVLQFTSNTDVDSDTTKEREIKAMQQGVKRSIASSIWNSPITMDDFTQKSSMSLTQEIPITAYSHLFSKKLLENTHSILKEHEDSHGNAQGFSNNKFENASEKEFQSTALACPVNDACYMKLDLEPGIKENKDDDSESLDTPRAVDQLRCSHRNLQRFDPQTPHISANPFKKRGSIMHKVDLFVATQPSSVNQYQASPTSSRPSPETYGDYSSPIKRQKNTDSPIDDVTNGKTTVKPPTLSVTQYFSKDQQLIRTPFSGLQSFDIKLKNLVSKSGHNLFSYTSMKESQERKSRELQLPASGDSDSSHETSPRRLRHHIANNQFPKVLLQNSQVYSKSLSHESSKNEIQFVDDRQIDQETSEFEAKTTDIHGKEKQDSILPSQSTEIAEILLQDSITANFRGIKNMTSEKSSSKTSLAREIENQDLVPLPSSDEPQLPKLNEKPNQNSNIIGNFSQTLAPKEALKMMSSRVLMKKNHLYSDLMETIPETSPLTHQIFSVDELSNIPFEESRNSNTNETIVFGKDVDSESEIRTHPLPAYEQNVIPRRVSPLLRTPTISKIKFPLNSPKHMVSIMNSTVVNSLPEVKKIRLTDKNSKNHDHILYPLINTHVSTSHKNNNHKSDSSSNHQVREKNLNNDKNNDSNKLISEPPKDNSGNSKSSIVNDKSESESLLKTASRMTSKTPEIQGNKTSSHTSNSILGSGSKIDTYVTSSLTIPAAICEDFTSSLRHLNNSKRQPITRKSKTSSTKTLVLSASNKRNVRRKSVGPIVSVTAPSTRSSKRQSLAHTTEEDSEDPLSARMTPALQTSPSSGLFKNMVFTVSFVKNDKERNNVIQLITENGGLLLDHGFDQLFEPISQSNPANHDCGSLSLSALGKSLSFACVIADEHSRKTKFVQALALGLPCLSGRWIQNCISKNTILDWPPYLLCAGQSLVLGNACRSRTLQPYKATDAEFSNTFATRKKILEGKSVLLVMGKGKTQQKRKTFNFLTRALGPTRIGHVTDITEAQKILSEDEAKGLHNWDILHVHDNDKNRGLDSLGAGRKRKFADYDRPSWPNLKRVRIITDEIMIQSLIFGELIEE
ncbi:putative dna damage repair protein [Erysiphe neolycopersici]|uniref:Putative dna damage repair protein n=1 Tax=Erysiphe neolycopersici TaxID=212602 RepID=A0A420HDP6_9PEZI|nr:putative dna damage repair protein [Erysiphe neolycopersici]